VAQSHRSTLAQWTPMPERAIRSRKKDIQAISAEHKSG
jgi:hypothetical protein